MIKRFVITFILAALALCAAAQAQNAPADANAALLQRLTSWSSWYRSSRHNWISRHKC